MKKIILYAAILCSIVASCKNEEKDIKVDNAKTISKRDLSITKANSYSDIFLDSMQMEKFIAENHITDSIAYPMRSFYNSRNYQYAWFSTDGLTEQARAFWNLHQYVTTYDKDSSLHDKKLEKRMNAIVAEDSLTIGANNSNYANTELTLTAHFMKYMLHHYETGYLSRMQIEGLMPKKKETIMAAADSLLNEKIQGDDEYIEQSNEAYQLLKEQLKNYFQIAKNGGWPQVEIEKKSLKKGAKAPEIVLIKKRLSITGDMPASDSSDVFGDTLFNGVQSIQKRYGYKPDGVITAQLVKDLNVPVENRIEQLLINMDRMRWMPTAPNGKLIVVNIPEFMLHVYEGKKVAFSMPVVVGKEGHNTTIFSGNMNQIVFSPYWNVPESIVKQEILPKLEADPFYLEEHNMEETGTDDDDSVPSIRQKPGPDNSLGRVKFLFPNSFNIYLHDTNAKSLFNNDKRAFSHGCIRLSDPVKLANYLLKDNPEWTPEKIEEAMNQTEPQTVNLKNRVPVMITYYTAWVDNSGKINFRDDIYDHDKELAQKMFSDAI
ncbi:MAG: L,D-transpeptidase family protein [Ilyomonas sp.]